MEDITEEFAVQKIAETYRKKYEELWDKINEYYHEEVIPRGDKGMIRDYEHCFGIE